MSIITGQVRPGLLSSERTRAEHAVILPVAFWEVLVARLEWQHAHGHLQHDAAQPAATGGGRGGSRVCQTTGDQAAGCDENSWAGLLGGVAN